VTPEYVAAVLDFWFGVVGESDDLTAATRSKIKRDGPRGTHKTIPALDQRVARTPSKEASVPSRPPIDVGSARKVRAVAERPLDVGAVRAARAAAAKPPRAAPAPTPKPRRGLPLGSKPHTYRVNADVSFTVNARTPSGLAANWTQAVEDLGFALRSHSIAVFERVGSPSVDIDHIDGKQFVDIGIDSRLPVAERQQQLRRTLAESAFRAQYKGVWSVAARDACREFVDRIASDRAGGPVGGSLLVQRASAAVRQVRR
jgi:hypothetical protein